MAISTTIKSIQDIMRIDVGVDGDAQRIGQLVWMLFLKIFDDREEEFELTEKTYRSPIPEDLRWREWAADPEGITGEELAEFINNELFPRLKELQVSPPANNPKPKGHHQNHNPTGGGTEKKKKQKKLKKKKQRQNIGKTKKTRKKNRR